MPPTLEQQVDALTTVMADISTKIGTPQKGRIYRGTTPCPVCAGTINWTWRGPRAMGFVCETVECVRALA